MLRQPTAQTLGRVGRRRRREDQKGLHTRVETVHLRVDCAAAGSPGYHHASMPEGPGRQRTARVRLVRRRTDAQRSRGARVTRAPTPTTVLAGRRTASRRPDSRIADEKSSTRAHFGALRERLLPLNGLEIAPTPLGSSTLPREPGIPLSLRPACAPGSGIGTCSLSGVFAADTGGFGDSQARARGLTPAADEPAPGVQPQVMSGAFQRQRP